MIARNCLIALSLAAGLPAGAADRAVVVGIDYYPEVRDTAQGGSGARNDAIRMQYHLVENMGFPTDAVTVLVDEKAKASDITDALIDKLVAETEPGDRAFFYFAGRGGRVPVETSQEADGYEEVLLASDAGSEFGAIPENALSQIFDSIADREVTLVIDASMAPPVSVRSGADALPRSASYDQFHPKTRSVKRADLPPPGEKTFAEPVFAAGDAPRDVWLAAAPSQVTWETPAGGVFTDLYLKGMAEASADTNNNGAISNSELLVFLRDNAETWCAENEACEASGQGLSPDFSGDLSDFAKLVEDQIDQISPRVSQPKPETVVSPPVPTVDAETEAGSEGNYENTMAFLTDLLAPNNAANLALDLSPSTELSVDDLVEFQIESERSGQLVLLDVNPKGELIQIFPSVLSLPDAEWLEADAPRVIPEAMGSTGRPLQIRVTEPYGKGVLIALLVEGELSALEDILPTNRDGSPIPNANQYLYQITQALLEMQAGPDGNSTVEWSAVYLPYEIKP